MDDPVELPSRRFRKTAGLFLQDGPDVISQQRLHGFLRLFEGPHTAIALRANKDVAHQKAALGV